MRRVASSSSRTNVPLLSAAGWRTSASASSIASQSLVRGYSAASRPLFSRSGASTLMAPPTTARLFARATTKHTHLTGRLTQQRFASTTTERFTSSGSGKTRIAAVLGVIVAAVGGISGIVFAAEGKDEDKGFLAGLIASFEAKTNQLLNNDSTKQVLPDPHPPPYGKAITVVISDDVLLVQEYQPMSGGMLTKKRPGVEFFLSQLSQDYEVVIWSLQPVTSFGPVIEKLDPNRHAAHRLFVDATVVHQGINNAKDLTLLNRPLDKMIMMDTDSAQVVQKENLIVSPKYDGALHDVYLLEVLNFFRLLAASSKAQPPDVRHWVAALQKHGVPYFTAKYTEAVRKAKEKAEEDRRARQEQIQMRDAASSGKRGW